MIGSNQFSFGLAYAMPWLGHDKRLKRQKPLDLFGFMEKCREFGLDGIQLADSQLDSYDEAYLGGVKDRAKALGLYLQFSHSGSLSDPFIEKHICAANILDCKIMRTTIGMLLRQTTIRTRDDWHKFRKATLGYASNIAQLGRKYGVKIAIENHFGDVTAEELLDVIEVDNGYLGVCFDTANSFSVAQEPAWTANLLARHVIASHLKDFLAVETSTGCTLYAVPLGQGHVDLEDCVKAVQQYNPDVMFTLEMVSGRTFNVPFLDESFYPGYDERDASDIVRVLRLIRDNPKKVPSTFVHLEQFTDDDLEYEDSNVRECVKYAREVLKI